MRIEIPRAGREEPVRIIIQTLDKVLTVGADGSHASVEVDLPVGLVEEDLSVTLHFCGHDGKPLPGVDGVVIREPKPQVKRVRKAKASQPSDDDEPVTVGPRILLAYATEPQDANEQPHEPGTSGPVEAGDC